jgi:hypothetical protein
MKKQITSISTVQTAKVAAIMYFVVGIVGCAFLLLSALLTPANRSASNLFIAILTPFIYAFIGFIVVFVGSWVYNQIAKRFGGIEFTVTEVRGEF